MLLSESKTRSPPNEQERQAAGVFFAQLFGQLAADTPGGRFSVHPLVSEAAVRLVASYAAFLANQPGSLHGVLGYLLRAMQVSIACVLHTCMHLWGPGFNLLSMLACCSQVST